MKSETRKNKNFRLLLAGLILLLTFALPIAEREKRSKKSRLILSHTITPTGPDTRSLNVWKRQIVRAFNSNVGSKNYKRNTKHKLVKYESDSHSTSAQVRLSVEEFYNGEFDLGSG